MLNTILKGYLHLKKLFIKQKKKIQKIAKHSSLGVTLVLNISEHMFIWIFILGHTIVPEILHPLYKNK